MKKILKIVICILIALIIGLGILYVIDRDRMKNNKPVVFSTWWYKYSPPLQITEQNNINSKKYTKIEDANFEVGEVSTDILVRYNDMLYGKSYGMIDYAGSINSAIGIIDKIIDSQYVPIINGETNTKELLNSLVIEANEKTMVLYYNNAFVLFERIKEDTIIASNEELNTFIGTILEETTTYMIVEPNQDEDERKISDKIKINYGTDHKDYLYGVGRKVLISYAGYIKETYPAQIDTNNISTDGYSNFEIIVKTSDNVSKKKILNSKDLNEYDEDYNLYYYGLDEVNIKVNNKTLSLEKALKDGKITLAGIIQKANKDLNAKIITGDTYKDGGSMIYWYEDYTVLKYHNLNGNSDVYIGIPRMNINDLSK